MQKIGNPTRWTALPEGRSLDFSNPRPRLVRVEVNAPEETRLYITDDSVGEVYFLARVVGLDVIEFYAPGAFQLMAEGNEEDGTAVYVRTADGDDVSLRVEAPVSFTKVVERRRRNPELERMMAVMQRNMEMRLEQTSREIERRVRGSQAAVQPVPAAPSVPPVAASASGEADGGEPSGAQAGAPGGGREGGAT